MEKVSIRGEYIRLDDLLKHTGAVTTGGHAKVVIQNGEVKVDGEICTMRGKKIRQGNRIEYDKNCFEIVENEH